MFHGRKFVLSLALGMFLALVAPAAHAEDALSAPPPFPIGGGQLVGSWVGSTSLGTMVLLTFHPDKTMTSTFHLPGVGAGNGHGTWSQTGMATFATTDIGLILDANNELALVATVQSNATVDGDEFTADALVTLTLPDGTPAGSFPGQVQGRRVQLQPLP